MREVEARGNRMRKALAWVAVLALMAALTALTTRQALERYRDLRTGWSWDLAYYNQWLWALTQGDGILSVRPLAAYAEEGPSVWKTNYLAPVRFAIVPFYRLFPDPRTLLVIQNVVVWWCLPAAFGLVLAESGSLAMALSAVALVPVTPLLWPLVWNDFRELQLAIPFVIWAFHGVRSRSVWLTVLGVVGLLACRQEFALLVASMAILPPRQPQTIADRYRWARNLLYLGLGWMFLVFFGYLGLVVGAAAPRQYLEQFGGPKAGLLQTLGTSLDFLLVGMGSWAVLSGIAPRVAILALPWVWSLASGRWALRLIGTEQWHHVRYAAPMAAVVLAAGLIGYARLGVVARKVPRGHLLLAAAWVLAAFGMIGAKRLLDQRIEQIPYPISKKEAAEIWQWIDRVGPDDGVLAVYDVTAPLSSRKRLYSYILDPNKPKGYPYHLDRSIRWVFLRKPDLAPQILIDQGFEEVHDGPFLQVFRR